MLIEQERPPGTFAVVVDETTLERKYVVEGDRPEEINLERCRRSPGHDE
jgi:hypothetical protein